MNLEHDDEGAADARYGLHRDAATVGLDEPLGDRQAQSRPRSLADTRAALKRFEDPLALRRGDAPALIDDPDDHPLAHGGRAHLDAAIAGVLDGVLDEVDEGAF